MASDDPQVTHTGILAKALRSRYPIVRAEAIDEIMRRGHFSDLEMVVRATRDPDPLVRTTAVEACGRIDRDDARVVIRNALRDIDEAVRLYASTSATQQGEIDALSEACAVEASSSVRCAMLIGLLSRGAVPASEVDLAIGVLRTEQEEMRIINLLDHLYGTKGGRLDGVVKAWEEAKASPRWPDHPEFPSTLCELRESAQPSH